MLLIALYFYFDILGIKLQVRLLCRLVYLSDSKTFGTIGIFIYFYSIPELE
jgi:hypothetical protein